MAIPAATSKTSEVIGIREDLDNLVSRTDPTDVPFQSNIGRAKAKAVKHEWQTQALASATNTNAMIEGNDAVTNTFTASVRVGNYVQTSQKTASVSGFVQEVDIAGRGDEMEYELLLKGLELKRDVETQLLSNQASVAGASGTARVSGSFGNWLSTNKSHGLTGATPGYSVTTGLVETLVAGVARSFTEAMIKSVMASAYTNGGRPKILMLTPNLKQQFSLFTGIAAIRVNTPNAGQATIIGAADVYQSDFGPLNTVVNIFQLSTDAYMVDTRMASLARVRSLKTAKLAKTGDSDREQILTDYTLKVHNEKAHGKVSDLSPT